jgi:hypothetical protein
MNKKKNKRNLKRLAKPGDCVVVREIPGLSEEIVHLTLDAEDRHGSLGYTACMQAFYTQESDGTDGEDSIVPGPWFCMHCALGAHW